MYYNTEIYQICKKDLLLWESKIKQENGGIYFIFNVKMLNTPHRERDNFDVNVLKLFRQFNQQEVRNMAK